MSRRLLPLAPALALALVAGLLLTPGTARTDDTVLFSTVVPPNVVLVADNSGSMNHVVWHPAFDPAVDYSTGTGGCDFWDNTTDPSVWYNVSPDYGGDVPDGDWDTTFENGTYTRCGNERTIFYDSSVEAENRDTRWFGRYLNWYFSDHADPYVDEILETNNGTFSACLGGGSHTLYRRARVTAAKQILREVICQVNAVGEVRFGVAQFRRGGDPHGGYVVVPANDYLDADGDPNVYSLNGETQSHADHLDEAIDSYEGEANTPLSETLFQIYTYFMSRNSSDRPDGADGSTTFPAYEYDTCTSCGAGGDRDTSNAPDSPVEWPCQRNFVVIITDGEPTRDDFDTSSAEEDQGFSDFGDLIGDYVADGEDEYDLGSEGTRFLDDIAAFMQQNDFRPDLDPHEGQEQVIDVYTVGFTTSPTANEILDKTAEAGNGEFYFSNDPDKLAQDIVAAINDIIRKSQAFTAATVPATRTSFGGQFYNSVFTPSRVDGYWQGHLRSWTIDATGRILQADGTSCALDDPDQTRCLEGFFKSDAVPHWDAGEELQDDSPAARPLYTSKLVSGTPAKVAFDTGNMTPADLEITSADIATYDYDPHAVPTDADELRDALVWNVRGCEMGSVAGGCVTRPWLLGDIFHSNPIVVGPPSSFRNDPDFRQFASTYATRDRVIAAGSNDGFLRLFDAGTYQTSATPPGYDHGTGAEVAGFAPYVARKNLKELPRESGGRTQYFVDGSPSVADVWFWQDQNVDAPKDGTGSSDWRTVLVGGMREGGGQYYALDVTNPDASNYPGYLWEFPREDAAAGVTEYVGETWAQPIITRIRVQCGDADGVCDRYVAVVTGGYDASGDPNDQTNYEPDAKAGRALYVLDVKTGEVLKQKRFDATGTDGSTDPAAVVYDDAEPERSMHFAFAATPGVYDLDFDGYADVIYAPDLGGNVWKWVISAPADLSAAVTDWDGLDDDGVDGAGNPHRHEFGLFFQAKEHTSGGTTYWKSFYFPPSATFKSGKLWLAFGSGERKNLPFEGLSGTTAENNRFYAVKDLDPFENQGTSPVLRDAATARLDNVALVAPDHLVAASVDGSTGVDVSNARGYYFVAEDGEKFVTESDIFFYYVFAASYKPTGAGNPCTSGGESKLYAFRIDSGEGLFTDDSSGDPVRSYDMGAGMPTDPRITIGVGSDGGGSPDPNRVIINKQDGSIVNLDAPPGFGAGIGQFYWRELDQ